MKNRLRRTERIARVLGQMRRAEELKLKEATRMHAEKTAEEIEMVRALSEGSLSDIRIAKTVARRLERASSDVQEAHRRIERQKGVCGHAKRRCAQAEGRLRQARQDFEREEELNELTATIDRVAAESASSVRQGAPVTMEKPRSGGLDQT